MKKNILYTILFTLNTLVVFAQNVPHPNIPAPKGLQVNSFTGNLFFQRNEQSLRGTGYRVYQSFYYNAATDTADYGYGHGWSFYYNSFYIEKNDTLIIQHSDAKKDTFLLVSGSYKSPVGVYDVLTKTGAVYTLTSKDGKKQLFENPAHKKITRITDPNGNFITVEYNGAYPSKIRNSAGRCLLLNWQDNHLASAKDSAYSSKSFGYAYDVNGDLIAVTNPLGGKMSFEYSNHFLLRMADENGNPVVIGYGSGSQVKTINSCNTEQQFSYAETEHRTYVSQKAQSGTILNGYYFDEKGRLIALSDADGNKTSFTYDNNNNLVSWKDFKGQATNYQYDSKGNLLKETDPSGNSVTYTYESNFNKVNSVKDKKGNTTSFTYDANGNLATVKKPGNITLSFTYDANGRLLTAKNGNNNTTTYEYNSDGDLIKIQYPVGAVQFEYNGSCCEVGKITDANGNTQEMTYDLLNRPTSIKDKTGNTVYYEYDAAGNIVKETDPNNVAKGYTYDALNRLISVTLKAGTWNYDYDEQSNLVKITDANGHITSYQYNNKSQLTKETDGIGNSTAYSYDVNGNLVLRSDPNGNTVAYTYDNLNRLTQKSYAGNTDNYSYDAAGNLVSAFNNNITYTFEYDNLNRLLKKNIPTWGKSISYTYDATDNRKTMTDQDGGLYNYQYDGNNRLTSLTNAANLTTSFEYDAGGRILKQNNANGTFTTYHYDAAGRMDSLINWQNSSNKISFFYYIFDRFGNRLSMQDKRGLNTYTYDSSYRLTKVVYADGTLETFNIDGTGNRTLRIKNSDSTHYTYNAADQIQNAGMSSFAFDTNGNTVQQNDSLQRKYIYDGENRLVEVELETGKNVQFAYDPLGTKILKIDALKDTKKLLYDDYNLLSELTNTNNTIKKYTTALWIDSWISLDTGGNNYFYHADGQKSITELSQTEGLVENSYDYDVFGNIRSRTGTINNNLLFQGIIYDDSLNLYDSRARFYNPIVGRFINKDYFKGKKTEPLSLNRYEFSQGNPVNFRDPLGLWTISVGIGVTLPFYTGSYSFNVDGHGHIAIHVTNGVGVGGGAGIGITGAGTNADNINELLNEGTIYGYSGGEEYYLEAGRITGSSYSGLTAGGGVGVTLPSYVPSLPQVPGLGSPYYYKTYTKCLFGYCPDNGDDNEDNKGSQDDIPDDSGDNTSIPVEVITPGDPNYITGTNGYDTGRKWVSVKANLPYNVSFENDPEIATAPAQKVTIYVPVQEKLNPNSLRLGDFGFGPFNFTVPPNTSFYTKRLDVKDSLGVFVDVTAGLDILNHRAFWIFQSIDPATGLSSTLAANAGFLPVNDSLTHKGEGYVNFTLQPSETDTTGDTTSAYASIVFDNEAALNTNTWRNTIDAVAPQSHVNPLQPLVDSVFTVSWTSQDDLNGSGEKNYELYSSKNNGAYTLYKSNIDSLSVSFTGEPGATYSFYTLATDNTGNKEASKTSGEQITTIKGNAVYVSVKAILGGAYQLSDGLMTDSLRVQQIIPSETPYKALGFVQVKNSNVESLSAGLLDSSGAKAIVDWVWLELRDAANPARVVATRSALIRRDGQVVDVDGTSAVYFPGSAQRNYYVALRHRNHLGVMTANAVTLIKDTALVIDFTSTATATYGTNAMQNIGGKMVVWTGDVNGNGIISYNGANNDKNAILAKVGLITPNNVVFGYDRLDCNLDGKISYNGAFNDKNKILSSTGLLTPNNTITEQLPK